MVPKLEVFSRIVQPAHKRPKDPGDPALSFNLGRVYRDNDILSAGNNRSFRKLVENGVGEVPAGNVDIDCHLVIELDPLELSFPSRRMVLNLIEDNHAVRAAGDG